MSRPVTIKPETILAAARKVFMKRGYRAGTALIAREAGVSEGSIFKLFKDKSTLFLAAMEVGVGEPDWETRLLDSAGRGDPHATLEAAGRHLLKQLRLILPRLMMITSSGITIPKHDQPGELPHPLRKIKAISEYFKKEVRAGRLVMDSPDIQAHAFLGALSHYAWCETLFGYRSAPPDTYVKTLVDTLLKASGRPTGGRGLPSQMKRASKAAPRRSPIRLSKLRPPRASHST